ncbi:hypothetical protein CHS0354_006650 [Potamilus streckersoni]|uniref:DUF7042 domain-containing protein n=1 Tax=Potamilus streckersoni TaxID=2493646 RepID=A0AAE0W2Y1_9BIVA|nr:hypothetical protein CHS0354_006650 [Potamilus streckersoni]
MIIISRLKLTWIVYLLEQLFFPVVSACTWPTALQDGVWIDSDKGNLTFNVTHMFGWSLKTVVSSTVVTDWVCQNNTGDFIVARASNNIDPLKSSFIAFLCLKMTQISNYSFYYYQHSAEQPNSNNERFAVAVSSNFASFISNLSNMCTETPATSEFHMLLKQGYQNESKVYCPDAFLGMFSYTFNNGSTTVCGNHNELWDVCSDRKAMTFNYNACTALIAYSVGGKVYCVNSLTSGSYYYAALYNTDATVSGVNTYRFTCLMGSLSGNDVYVSQSPKSCTKTQTPTSVPVTANDTSLGAFMYLKAYRFETSSASAAGTPNVGAIVGGTIGGLLLLAVLVGAVFLLYPCVLKKPSSKKLLEDDTSFKVAETKQSTFNTAIKKVNSLPTIEEERSDDTLEIETETEEQKEATSPIIVEQSENIPKTEEKISIVNEILFSKECAGLDVTQQPPDETAFRPLLCFSPSTLLEKALTLSISKDNQPDRLTSSSALDGSFTLSIRSSRPSPFSERVLSKEPLPEYSEHDSVSESSDEDTEQDTAESVEDQIPLENPHPKHGYISFADATKFAKNSVSVFDEYGGFPPPGFRNPKNKSPKSKRKRKKKRRNKVKLVSFRSPSTFRNSSLRTTSRSTRLSVGSQVSSSKMSISETSGMSSAFRDSPVSNNDVNRTAKRTADTIAERYHGAPAALIRTITAAVIEEMKRKGLLNQQLFHANPDLFGKDTKLNGKRSTIRKPATPTSTGLGELAPVGQGPVNVDIP